MPPMMDSSTWVETTTSRRVRSEIKRVNPLELIVVQWHCGGNAHPLAPPVGVQKLGIVLKDACCQVCLPPDHQNVDQVAHQGVNIPQDSVDGPVFLSQCHIGVVQKSPELRILDHLVNQLKIDSPLI